MMNRLSFLHGIRNFVSPMIIKLRRKRTLAVVGVLIVLMVGVVIKFRSYSEWKRERIELAERLLNRKGFYYLLTFTDAKVTQDADNQLTIEGHTVTTYRRGHLSSHTPLNPYVILIIKKSDGEHYPPGDWYISERGHMVESYNKSLWNRIKEYVTSFLP